MICKLQQTGPDAALKPYILLVAATDTFAEQSSSHPHILYLCKAFTQLFQRDHVLLLNKDRDEIKASIDLFKVEAGPQEELT